MATPGTRPDSFVFHNGEKAVPPFSRVEYARRLQGLRVIMAEHDLAAVLLTSMHAIAYYSGFLYCSFGRSYACVVTEERCVTISANIDGGQPWRRSMAENVVYTRLATRQLLARSPRRAWQSGPSGGGKRSPDARERRTARGTPGCGRAG